MKLSTAIAALLMLVGAGIFGSSVAAQSRNLTPDAFEFKVMLKNSLFDSNSKNSGIDDFERILGEQPGIVVKEDKKEKSRVVSYLDTVDCDLRNNNYILRKRFTLKGGVPDSLKVTLKYRSDTSGEVRSKKFKAKPSSDLTASKFEVDVVKDSSSQTRKNFSYSGSVELGKIKNIYQLKSLYPVISELGINDKKKLKRVNGFTAFESIVELGTIKIAGQKCEAAFSFWYKTRGEARPLVSEFSYVCNKYTNKAQKLYQAILGLDGWVDDGLSTKAAIAYGNYCNN